MESGPRRVEQAYAAVRRQVEAQSAQLQAEEAALVEREASIAAQIATLQAEAAEVASGLARIRAESGATLEGTAPAIYDALFEVLRAQSEAIGERASLARAAEVAADKDLLAELVEDPARAELLQEYLQFIKQIAPGLAAFPEDYRRDLQNKHLEVKEGLYAYFEKRGPHYATVDAPALEVDVVVAVDELDDEEVVVTVVVPVSSEVQLTWADRQDSLSTCFAARCVEGTYRAAIGLGHPTAQVVFGGHRGLLVAELALGADPNDAGPAVAGAIQAALDRAPELVAAGLACSVRAVGIDELMPAELFEEGGEDAG